MARSIFTVHETNEPRRMDELFCAQRLSDDEKARGHTFGVANRGDLAVNQDGTSGVSPTCAGFEMVPVGYRVRVSREPVVGSMRTFGRRSAKAW